MAWSVKADRGIFPAEPTFGADATVFMSLPLCAGPASAPLSICLCVCVSVCVCVCVCALPVLFAAHTLICVVFNEPQAHHANAGTELPMEVAVLQAALQQ